MPGEIPEAVNAEQARAIRHGAGPLLIIAGAGTGKTTVVTERIADLILNRQIPADNILALTFTDKAAGEMQDRVERILPYGYVDLWVMTFHSLGQRLLQEHAIDIGLANDFKLLSETDQWLLIREHLDDFKLAYYRPLGNPTRFISALVKHFSRLKDEDISVAAYLEYARSLRRKRSSQSPEQRAEADRILELAQGYQTYTELLRAENAMDFGDLILSTLRLFRERPAILRRYQEKFQYVLVDEFQDTNLAQFELIRRLAAPRNNLTVVGDDDQSIYKFRGASVSNILGFQKSFPESEVVVLTKNYRTRQAILDLSYKFIQRNNPDRLETKVSELGGISVSKKLEAQRGGDGMIELLHAETQETEARVLADKITALREQNSKLGWDAFSVLVRANDHAEPFLREFERRGWPHVFLAARGLLTKPLVLDILAYLRMLDDYHENAAVYRVLAIPVLGILPADIVEIAHQAKRHAWSIYEALKNLDRLTVTSETRVGVARLMTLIERHTAMSQTKPVGEVTLSFLNDSGYLSQLTREESSRSEQAASHLRQFFKLIEDFQRGERPALAKRFLQYVEHMADSGNAGGLEHDLEMGPDAIRIMTIHAAKGLEFNFVFVANVVEQRFPGVDRRDAITIPEALVREILPTGDAHLQEERRLMYVAITRARDGVFFTAAEDYGGQRRKRPSKFLYELGLLHESPIRAPRTKPVGMRQYSSPAVVTNGPVARRTDPRSFSFTSLSTYRECPWRYRYAYVLQVPKRGNHALSYGSSIHKTLLNFFTLWKDRSSDRGSRKKLVSREELMTIYHDCFIDEWYPSRRLRDEYFKKGESALAQWYRTTLRNPPEVLRLEQVFNLKVDQFVVRGAIDRIDQMPRRSAKDQAGVRIVDYKTGKVKEKFDRDDRYQLLIYALAVKDPRILGQAAAELEYYFIDENQSRVMTPSEKEETATLEWVRETIGRIRAGDFQASPSPMICKFCDFRDICEFRAI